MSSCSDRMIIIGPDPNGRLGGVGGGDSSAVDDLRSEVKTSFVLYSQSILKNKSNTLIEALLARLLATWYRQEGRKWGGGESGNVPRPAWPSTPVRGGWGYVDVVESLKILPAHWLTRDGSRPTRQYKSISRLPLPSLKVLDPNGRSLSPTHGVFILVRQWPGPHVSSSVSRLSWSEEMSPLEFIPRYRECVALKGPS